MPWLKVEKRHDNVKTESRGDGNDEVGKNIVSYGKALTAVRVLDLADNNVDNGKRIIHHDNGVNNHTRQVQLLSALGSITQR